MKPLKILFYKKNSVIAKTSKVYPFSIVLNSTIQNYSYISYNCTVNNTNIGKFCSIGKGVKIGLGKHPTNFVSTSPVFYSPNNPLQKKISQDLMFKDFEPVKIGNDVWIGANSIILDGITINDGAIIGANTVVSKDVEPYSVIGGVPGRLIKKRFSDEIIQNLLLSKWWEMPIEFFEIESVKSIFSKELSNDSVHSLINLIDDNKI